MNNIEIIEHIMQLTISNFIKNNRTMDPKKLTEEVEKLLNKKEQMYQMDEVTLKHELIKLKGEI